MLPTQDALSPDSLLSVMTKSLPEGENKQLIKDPFAAIALFCHACMLVVGFKLVGLGEDHTIETQSDQEVQRLPHDWDASSSSAFAFRYAHPPDSGESILRVSRLGGKALVFGLALGDDDKTASFEIPARDYVSEKSAKEETWSADNTSALRNIFISTDRISDLAALMDIRIIKKVAPPEIQKTGHGDSTTAAAPATRQESRRYDDETRQPVHDKDPSQDDQPTPAKPYPLNDPLAEAPQRARPSADFPPPDFEDEYELNTRPQGSMSGSQPFGNIGERDLYPPGLAPHDPLRIGPSSGGYRGGGGGMYPTFDDPIFGGTSGGAAPYDTRAPPGARYDPLGPGDGTPSLRGSRFPGGPRGGGGGGGGGVGGFGGNPFGAFGSGDFI